MIIEKDWFFKLRDKKTNKTTCRVLFRVVDSNRKVNINTTGILVCEIKRWIKIYKEKIIPGLDKNQKKYKETKDNVSYWDIYKDYLIPENRSPYKEDFTKQHFVKLNYKLLEPDKLLTYNQGLFLLLGLDSTELDHSMRDFPVLDGARPANAFEFIFWNTEQNQMLKTSNYVKNRKITSKDLIKLADKYDFFIKKDSRIIKRHLNKNISKKIYKVLTSHNYITGCYDDMWEWNKSIERNKLSYLATRLKQKRILGNHCHKELSNYIPDPKPNSKKPLKNITEISSKAKKIIDDIVDEIIR